MIIAFILTMPGNNAWNGKWTGDDKLWVVTRSVQKLRHNIVPQRFSYNFGDGWRAAIETRLVNTKERRRLLARSAGFCGYDWMVDSIVVDGDIYGPEKEKPVEDTGLTVSFPSDSIHCNINNKPNPAMTPAALKALTSGQIENFIAASTPGGIEAQEKRGQIEQSFAETLPKEGTGGEKRKLFEAMGFVFGEDADDIFIEAKFPVGWRKSPTEHSMWSDLLDEKGRKRGAIFYKAAFYDRSAHIHLNTRFRVGCYRNTNDVVILDCDEVVKVIGTHPAQDYKAMDVLREEAVAWLEKHYPKVDDVMAYWD